MSTPVIPSSEPLSFAAGDSLSWTKTLSDYLPADGWSLLYCFRGNGGKLDAASTTYLATHLISIDAAASAALLPGPYAVAGYALLAPKRVRIFSGQIVVLPNLQTADDSFDPRTQERRTLDNINAVIEGRATSTILKSVVQGTVLERIPLADLLNLQAIYQIKVRNQEIAELQAQGRPTGRTIFAAFTKPK